MKKNKNDKGITLIALVITIIVLLILAGISIATLTGENGVLTKASTAKVQTEIEEAKEQAKLDIVAWTADKLEKGESTTLNDSIIKGILTDKDYVEQAKDTSFISKKGKHEIPYSDLYKSSTGGGSETGGKSELEKAKETGTVLDENNPVTIKDKYDNEIRVPEGFKIASDSADDVTGGVVIEDVSAGTETTEGSQFVWIPVGEVKYAGGSKTITLGRYDFAEDGTPSAYSGDCKEENAKDIANLLNYGNTIAKDIEAFKTNATINHGFYIGRYEAGDPTATVDRTSSSSRTTPMACKEGQYVYNYITQPQAATLARGMYTDKKFTSDLVNNYAWDTAIVFIQEFSGDNDYARQNAIQSTLAQTGKATDGTSKDVRCNIYDMAGNCYEWTTETSSFSYEPCVFRGGDYGWSEACTSFCNNTSDVDADDYYSFRTVLYVDV